MKKKEKRGKKKKTHQDSCRQIVPSLSTQISNLSVSLEKVIIREMEAWRSISPLFHLGNVEKQQR